jgi:hypothetical protein
MGVTRTHLPLFLEPQSKYLSGGASSSATLLRRAISKCLVGGMSDKQAGTNSTPPRSRVTRWKMLFLRIHDNKTAGNRLQPSIS